MDRQSKIELIKALAKGKKIEGILASKICGVVQQTTLAACEEFIRTGNPEVLQCQKYDTDPAYLINIEGETFFLSAEQFVSLPWVERHEYDKKGQVIILPCNGRDISPGMRRFTGWESIVGNIENA